MPCGDPGGGGQCHLLHVRDLSVKDLEAVIRKRKAEKRRAAENQEKKESAQERRARLIDEFIDSAVRTMKNERFTTAQKIMVIFSEADRVETYLWRWGEIQINLGKWLKACRPFPTKMRFKFHLMEDLSQQQGSVPVLWSWHTHKY